MNARSKPTESHRHPDIRLTLTLMSHTAWNVGRELTNPGEDEWMCMAWQFGRRKRYLRSHVPGTFSGSRRAS